MGSDANHGPKRRSVDFAAIAYETQIAKDRDYLLHLPNGETVWLAYSDEEGPIVEVGMWPGEEKTYIEVRNDWRHVSYEHLR